MRSGQEWIASRILPATMRVSAGYTMRTLRGRTSLCSSSQGNTKAKQNKEYGFGIYLSHFRHALKVALGPKGNTPEELAEMVAENSSKGTHILVPFQINQVCKTNSTCDPYFITCHTQVLVLAFREETVVPSQELSLTNHIPCSRTSHEQCYRDAVSK